MSSTVTEPTTDDRAARAALAVVSVADEQIEQHVRAHGPEATLAALRRGSRHLDPDRRLKRRLNGVDGEALLEAAEATGARYVCPGDPEWPATLARLDQQTATDNGPRWLVPPLGLWVRGEPDLAEVTNHAVAVVGARAATEYGQTQAASLAADLADKGWTITAGGSYGCDAAAHRGALAVGGLTLAVLPCGIDMAYPRGNADLLDRITSTGHGLVISEAAPGMQPSRGLFQARARLLAALTEAVVVIEAAAIRSGAMAVADWAVELGRPLGAMPGLATSPVSMGCHRLIHEGRATLVADIDDALEVIGGTLPNGGWTPPLGDNPWPPEPEDDEQGATGTNDRDRYEARKMSPGPWGIWDNEADSWFDGEIAGLPAETYHAGVPAWKTLHYAEQAATALKSGGA